LALDGEAHALAARGELWNVPHGGRPQTAARSRYSARSRSRTPRRLGLSLIRRGPWSTSHSRRKVARDIPISSAACAGVTSLSELKSLGRGLRAGLAWSRMVNVEPFHWRVRSSISAGLGWRPEPAISFAAGPAISFAAVQISRHGRTHEEARKSPVMQEMCGPGWATTNTFDRS
jgi:hypothetical protein